MADTLTFPLASKLLPTSGVGGGDNGGGCFIATAAFGSYSDPSVRVLREFRDTFLSTTDIGRAFVQWYYQVSPAMADSVRASGMAKATVRIVLLPVVAFAQLCLSVGLVPTLLLLALLGALAWKGAVVLRTLTANLR